MNLTAWILLAALTAYALKLFGYLLPQSLLDRPPVHDLAGALTVGLLASLTVLNTFGGRGPGIALDSRVLALVAAGIALKLKAPYIVVVLVGALTAAIGRRIGLP